MIEIAKFVLTKQKFVLRVDARGFCRLLFGRSWDGDENCSKQTSYRAALGSNHPAKVLGFNLI